MLRLSARPVFSPLTIALRPVVITVQCFSSARNSTASEEDIQAARKWLENLHAETIPKNIGELSFSRSSGPGGQNVNKVNSKATLKVPLDSLFKLIPNALHIEIASSRYVATRTNSLIIQADDSRKQNDNAHSCYARLHQMIMEAGHNALPGETSPEQAERVKKLQSAENEHRLKNKKRHSAKKSTRRSRGDD